VETLIPAEGSRVEVFERAAAVGGQLLQAERLPSAGGSDDDAVALLLTFDVGRILVSFDSETSRPVATHLAEAEDVPDGFVNANEEEPWWRLLGTPLVHAAASEDAAVLRLEFQVAEARSRTLAVVTDGVRLRATLETGG
jgi:hypothetical protein